MTIHTRAMNESDLPAAHALSQAVRWPHRIEDWQFIQRLGSGFVAEENGALVGTALCWQQGEQHGTLGMIIVSPQHQGKGIGGQLMQLVLAELGPRCTLLNATTAGQPLYEKLGFQATGTLFQHQGTMLPLAPVPLRSGESIRPARPDDVAAMIALANRASGMRRDAVLTGLLAVGQAAVLERDGEVAGFSCLRRFGRGQVIGPLVAADGERARALIAYWSSACAGTFLRMDIPDTSGLGEWLAQAGLTRVDSGVIMARNGAARQDGALQQFAIINQALC